ncbi:MAG: YdcF family protein [Desulfotomaculum sp.]|nr:YdcF family protein [Desulfotomaculum sp.]
MNKQSTRGVKHRLLWTAALVLIPVAVAALVFIPGAGRFLVSQDNLQKSDIIVVLMGSIPDRVLETADLYHQGYAEEIIMIESFMVGYETLVQRGVSVPGQAKLSKLTAIELGVPEEKISLVPGGARSTKDEAAYIRDYLKKRPDIDSVILVTSKYHSTRAKKIFTKTLGSLDRDITIISSPSKYDTFNPDAWWQNREDAKRVLLEYLKLADFYLN